MSRIDQVLDSARARLRRLAAEEVPAALHRGALLVDIRPRAQRRREGEVPDALNALVIFGMCDAGFRFVHRGMGLAVEP